MDKEEKIKEEIKFHVEKLRLGTAYLLTVGGATITMIIDGNMSGPTIFFTAWGLGFSVLIVTRLYQTYKTLKRLVL